MSPEHITAIHAGMTFLMDNLVVDSTFMAEFMPQKIFTNDMMEDVMVN